MGYLNTFEVEEFNFFSLHAEDETHGLVHGGQILHQWAQPELLGFRFDIMSEFMVPLCVTFCGCSEVESICS